MNVSIISTIANRDSVKGLVKWALKDSAKKAWDGSPVTNLQLVKKHFPAVTAAVFDALYIRNTIKSKDIPEERKKPLVCNHIITGVLGIAGGYAIGDYIARFSKALGERYALKYPVANLGVINLENAVLHKGLKSMVPLLSFELTVRLLSPIIATPLASKAYNYLVDKGYIKK